MELGEALRAARLEAGLSQRELCGGEITRNMLSQIENGSAQPSLGTLRYLAARLGKPLAYFLEEEGLVSENQGVVESAQRLLEAGEDAQAALVLAGYRWGDPVFDRTAEVLWAESYLRQAEAALASGRVPYARDLLEKARGNGPCPGALERRWLLLWGNATGEAVAQRLPSLDGELLLRAKEALPTDPARAGKLLDACEDQKTARWLLLRADAYYAEQKYRRAAQCCHAAEPQAPRAAAGRLEACYRELGDYRRAYEYSKKI